MITNSGKTNPSAPGGLYTGAFHTNLLKEKNIFRRINPLRANTEILRKAEFFRAESKKDIFHAIQLMHDQVRLDGGLGISFDLDLERPDGCFRADELIISRRGICLEQTYLFLSILVNGGANDDQTTIIGFMTRHAFGKNNSDHAFAAMLVDGVPKEFVHLAYGRFYHDRQFRENVLAVARRQDSETLGLMILDLTTAGMAYVGFGAANHKRIVPMSNELLLASYFVNSGTYFLNRQQEQEAMERYNAALKLCPDAHIALDGMSDYLMSQKRYSELIELTSKTWKNLGPRTIVNRAAALFKTGQVDISELFGSLQPCIDYPDAYIFVSSVLHDIGLYSEAKTLLEKAAKKIELKLDERKSSRRLSDSPIIKFVEDEEQRQIASLESDLFKCLDKLKLYRSSIV